MKKILIELCRTALPLLILLVGSLGCFALYEMRSIPAEKTPEKTDAPVVEIAPIRQNHGGFDIVVSGEVVPYREIQISAEVCGRIVTDNIRSGFFVEKGALLLEIDPTNYQLDSRRYKEQVKQVGIQIDENAVEMANIQRLIELTQQDLLLQKKECDRMASLIQSHAVSESEFETAKRNVLTAELALAQLENQSNLLRQKRINLESEQESSRIQSDRAEEDLLRTKIFAPCDGVILRDETEPGNYVSVGQSLFYLEDVSKVEVRCQLQTKDIFWLWAQQQQSGPDRSSKQSRYRIPESPVKISYSIEGQTFFWSGILKRFDGHGLNASTRTAPVLIEVPNPENVVSVDVLQPIEISRSETGAAQRGRGAGEREAESLYRLRYENGSEKTFSPPSLARGNFVSVSIHVEPDVALWRVPTDAVRPGNKIYVTSGDRLEIHDIHVVQRNGSETIFRPGSGKLNPDDFLVVSPIGSVEQGMAIRVRERIAVAEGNHIVHK